MARQHEERRLITILAADLVGYSRLMAADEAGTFARLKADRKELIEPKAAEYHGRVVKLTGDGTLMAFGSVVDAVLFAVDVQRAMIERDAAISEDRRIRYRIGINIGEIIVDGEDIYGDGVNIAARLEQIAEPGSVYLSRSVYNQIKGKVALGFEDLGEKRVKNIPDPVRVYRVDLSGTVGDGLSRWPVAGDLPLPDKPSIAVLPFENMSSDPEVGYLGDGLAEDIITTLSKISSLFVIARNSSFAYKGKAADVRRIARELGVRHVLEGSVRSAGGRLRITAQLIDAVDGHHLWAERYDRKLEDVFDIQDEMTREIVTALRIKLSDGEQAQVWLRGTQNFGAWMNAMQALELVMQATPSEVARARELFQSAVDADPDYTFALAWIGKTHWFDVRFGFSDSPEESLATASGLAQRALKQNPLEPYAHHVAGAVLALQGCHEEAVAEDLTSIQLSPNDAYLKMGLARVLVIAGRPEQAEAHVREAMRLNPHYPNLYLGVLANALEEMRRDGEAVEILRTAIGRDPNYFAGRLRLASLLALAGRLEEAGSQIKEALRINPRFNLTRAASFYPTSNPESLKRFVSGLRSAGLPE